MKEKLIDQLLDYLFHQVVFGSGGDGAALWYSKYTKLEEILPRVEFLNRSKEFGWSVEFDSEARKIMWSHDQEFVLITDSESLYASQSKGFYEIIVES